MKVPSPLYRWFLAEALGVQRHPCIGCRGPTPPDRIMCDECHDAAKKRKVVGRANWGKPKNGEDDV